MSINDGSPTIEGATDGTLIGNVEDRLKVDSKTAESGLDSFGRARISESQVIFDASFVDSSRDNLFDSRLTGSATIQRDTLRKTMKVHTTTSASDSATFQSKLYHHYVPGQSFSSVLSFKFDSAQTNLEQCIGLFDDDNGIFLRLKNSTLELVKRTSTSGSVVETVVPQASWNIDVLDGSGPSGITLDITKEQIFRIDYQWLGVGRVRASFDIDGEPVKFHEFLHANNTDTIYMQTASLPVRAEVINNATISGDATLEFNCCSVLSEGRFQGAAQQHSVFTSSAVSIVNSAVRPVISVRLKSANIRGQLKPLNASMLATTNDNVRWDLVLNGTLSGGASWVSAGADSIFEFDESSTGISGGQNVVSGFISKSGGSPANISDTVLRLAADIAGNADILTLTARSITTNADVYGALTMEEIFS